MERWCFISYVFFVKGNSSPQYGNSCVQMTGTISDDKGFLELNKFVKGVVENDTKAKNLSLSSDPVILFFKEL